MSDRLALIIANSEFDDPNIARLVTPSRDAEALAQVLSDPAIGGFEVTLLVNKTMLEVRRGIEHLYQRKKRGDLLLLYYSGHGAIDEQRGNLHLAVTDTEKEYLGSTSVEAAFVCNQLDRSSSQRKVVILDCCHSGAFARGAKALGSSAGTQEAFAGSGYGRVILTASNAIEYAWEGDEVLGEAARSVFTHFLVEGLQTGAADRDGDGEISLDELYDYVYERVITSGFSKQTPQKWAQKVEGRIIIARSPVPPAPEMSLPGWIIEALASGAFSARMAAVAELAQLSQGEDQALAALARAELELLSREDETLTVRGAAAGALGISPVAAPAKPSLPPLPPVVIEKAEPEPKPELHPSLALGLSVKPQMVDTGGETTWTVTLRNDGDDDLRHVTVRRGRTLLDDPFDLAAGEGRRFTFTTTHKTEGKKTEKVTATGIASNDESVRDEAITSVQVREVRARQRELKELYQEAQAKVKSGAWTEAKELCQRIEALEPGYRDVGELLRKAEAGLRQKQVQKERQGWLAQAYEQLVQAREQLRRPAIWAAGLLILMALLTTGLILGRQVWEDLAAITVPTEQLTATSRLPTATPTQTATPGPRMNTPTPLPPSPMATPGPSPTPLPPPPTATPGPSPTPRPIPTQYPDGTMVYIVEAGDTLFGIAMMYGVDADQIRELNAGSIGPNDLLEIGQKLVISLPSKTVPENAVAEVKSGGASICVLAYHDRNGDTFRNERAEELMPNAEFTVADASGVVDRYTSDGVHEPHCFTGLAPGAYQVIQNAPPGYESSGPAERPVVVAEGTSLDIQFGNARSESPETPGEAPTPASESEGESGSDSGAISRIFATVAKVTGILMLILVAGVAILFVALKRRRM